MLETRTSAIPWGGIVCPLAKLSLLLFSVSVLSSGEVIVVAKAFFFFLMLKLKQVDKKKANGLKQAGWQKKDKESATALVYYVVSCFEMLFSLLVCK